MRIKDIKEIEQQLTESQQEALNGVKGDHRHALSMWNPGTPEYEEAEEELQGMMTSNPRLYTKICNLD